MLIAVIADVHSNLEALKAVLADIKKQDIKRIYCCGDIVGYNANPGRCMKLLQEKNVKCVQGNHDFVVVTLQNIEWFNDYARSAIMWTYKQLWRKEKKYLLTLPVKLVTKKITMFHGSPRSMYEYIYPNSDLSAIASLVNTRMLFLGHTHIPFVADVDGVLIVNPGSVGQPRDNDPRASYAIVNTTTLTASIHRVDYNIKAAARKVVKAGLPAFLAERLYRGV